jgi:hypothetical protein
MIPDGNTLRNELETGAIPNEITSYVWNDFEIIARISDIRHNEHLGNTLDDSAIAFADWIYNEYRQGRFPTPPLPRSICG